MKLRAGRMVDAEQGLFSVDGMPAAVAVACVWYVAIAALLSWAIGLEYARAFALAIAIAGIRRGGPRLLKARHRSQRLP